MKNNKLFPYIVALSAISISFSAAFYSIFGIGKMFAGASTNVMVMAASLEFAKLVIASFLYRFWDDVNKALRVYLTIACFLLIVITSAGIYGFLSSAYQETANKVENVDKNTAVIVKRKEMVQRQLEQAEKQLEFKSNRQNTLSDMRNRQQGNADNLISQNKSASAVRAQMNQLSKESSSLDQDIKVLQDTIASKTKQIGDLETEILGLSTNKDLAAEVGPLKYIAKITGKTLDQVVNWFIVALMLVFDPLAIALVVAANFVFSRIHEENEKKRLEKEAKEVKEEVKEEKEEEKTEEESTDSPSILEKIKGIFKKQPSEELEIVFSKENEISEIPEDEKEIEEEVVIEEPEIDSEEEEEKSNDFIIGITPVIEGENKDDSEINTEENISNEESESVLEEVVQEAEESEDNEGDEEASEEDGEEGEFGGYKLGNVYKEKPRSLKDADPKNVPPELLITKGDPTRL